MDNSEDIYVELPSPTKSEEALELSATVSSFAPWIGGPISNVLSGISLKRKMSRVNECLKAIASHIESVHDKMTEEFVKTEDFEDLLEQTLKRVAEERNEEKRKLFAAFLLKNIGKSNLPYERRLKLLKVLEELQLSGLILLNALSQTPAEYELNRSMGSVHQTLTERAPEIVNEIDQIAKELERLDLVENLTNSMRTMMTGQGAADLRNRMTSLGQEFLFFIAFEH